MKRRPKLLALVLSIVMVLGTALVPLPTRVSAAPADTGTVSGVNENGLAENAWEGAILHAWCWNFNTIKENMSEIAAAGFSAIQTSPICKVIVGESGGLQISGRGKWYYHYQPTEYVIGNYQLGTEEEFREMCEVAHSYGIKIIADSVINHCTSSRSAVSPNVFAVTAPDDPFHGSTGTSWSETDRYEETQNSLNSLLDWNTQDERVQQYLLNFLKSCVEAGADGFRYDAAKLIELPDDVSEKHPEKEFASDFWPIVLQNGSVYQYGEDLQEGGLYKYSASMASGYDDHVSSRLGAYQALTYGENQEYNLHTTNSFYGFRVRDAVTHDNVTADWVGDFIIPEGASASKVVTWVESHDNYCNDNSWSELDVQQVIEAYAILASRKDGTPLFFDRPRNSTMTDPWGDNQIGPTGSDMYKDSQVVAVNFFRNEMAGKPEHLSNPDGNTKLLMVERGEAGKTGAVFVNVSDEDVTLNGANTFIMEDGTYTDKAFGGTFTVEGGKISGTIKAGQVAVVYDSEVTPVEFQPEVGLSVASGNFTTDALNVTMSIRGCDSATLKVGDAEPIAVVDGQTVTVGADLAGDESVTVVLTGVKGDQTAEATATYTKKIYKKTTIVYFEKAARPTWNDVCAYLWYSGNLNNGGWPGARMEDMGDGTLRYIFPFECEDTPMHVIFSNGGSSQLPDVDAVPEKSMIYTAAGTWEEYTPCALSVSPASQEFTGSLNVTFSMRGMESASYSIDGGESVAITPETSSLTIDETMVENGGSVEITATGTGTDGETYTKTAVYTRRDAIPTNLGITTAAATGWSRVNFRTYATKEDGTTVGTTTGAGTRVRTATNGVYPFSVPYAQQVGTISVAVSDNNNSTRRVDFTIQPGESKIVYAAQTEDGAVTKDSSGKNILLIGDYIFVDGAGIVPTITIPQVADTMFTGDEIDTGLADTEAYTVTGTTKATEPGTYEATLTLTDEGTTFADGTRELTLTWKIMAASMDYATISEIGTQYYTGEAIEPAVTVSFGSTVLEKDVDYTVEYTDNVEIGTATVTITGITLEGVVTKTFEIMEKPVTGIYLDTNAVSGWSDYYVYVYGTNEAAGGWPGMQMQNMGNGIYGLELPVESDGTWTIIYHDIVNDGTNRIESGNQVSYGQSVMYTTGGFKVLAPEEIPQVDNVAIAEELIAAIGDVTWSEESKAAIDAANAAVAALTPEEREQLTGYDTLVDAIRAFAEAANEAATTAKDEAEAARAAADAAAAEAEAAKAEAETAKAEKEAAQAEVTAAEANVAAAEAEAAAAKAAEEAAKAEAEAAKAEAETANTAAEAAKKEAEAAKAEAKAAQAKADESKANAELEAAKKALAEAQKKVEQLDGENAELKIKGTIAKIKKVKAGKKKATVTIKSAGPGFKYEIYVSKKSKKGFKKSADTDKLKTVIKKMGKKKLSSKKTYYVKVRAYKEINGKKIYTAWSEVKKVKIK